MSYSVKKTLLPRALKETAVSPASWANHGISPLLARLYVSRGLEHPGQASYDLDHLLPPDGLLQHQQAAELLGNAVMEDQAILILGDYDTDGASAAALGRLGLNDLGSRKVSYLVPNRFDYGYGLSEEIARVAVDRHPDLVITVDNGINSIAGVSLLKNAGIRVLITDHHLPGESLPDADAILNPNQPGCRFPSKHLAGVGVMFYLLLLARRYLRDSGWFGNCGRVEPNLAKYLDLVALGTVADLVPLDYNNRLLVHHGLLRIRSGRGRLGIVKLLEAGRRSFASVTSTDLAFTVAPRLNAAGRLDDISLGIECLLANDSAEATSIVKELDQLNKKRREIEQDMQVKAREIVDDVLKRHTQSAGELPAGYCLFDEGWHQGITGLVASRIKEQANRPTIAFALTASGELTGSARSVSGLHIRDLLESVANSEPGLIKKFGGHAAAAGLTLHTANLERFTRIFLYRLKEKLPADISSKSVITDGELEGEYFAISHAQAIKFAAPWGQGFPAPLFHGRFYVENVRVVGGIHLKMRLANEDYSRQLEAIAFRALEEEGEAPDLHAIEAVYELDVNEFRGKAELQLVIRDFWHCEAVQENPE